MKKFAVGFYVGGGEYLTYVRFKADSLVKTDYNKVMVDWKIEVEFGELIETIIEEK